MFWFKRRNEEKEHSISNVKEYTVFITESFTREDEEIMLPILTLSFTCDGFIQEAVLCRDKNLNGELDLNEAEELMIQNIEKSKDDRTFLNIIIHNVGLTEKESEVANRLYESAGR